MLLSDKAQVCFIAKRKSSRARFLFFDRVDKRGFDYLKVVIANPVSFVQFCSTRVYH